MKDRMLQLAWAGIFVACGVAVIGVAGIVAVHAVVPCLFPAREEYR